MATIAAVPAAGARPLEVDEGVPSTVRHWEEVTNATAQARGAGQAGSASGQRHAVFQALGRTFEIELEPNQLFAPGARNVWVGEAGQTEEAPSAQLYRGHLIDEPDSWVRVSLRDGAFDGMIHTSSETYFVEPRSRYFASAAAHEMIAYRLSDTDSELDPGRCAVQHPPADALTNVSAVQRSFAEFAATAVAGAAVGGTYRQTQIGLVADSAYFQIHGANSAAAMQTILNQIDGIYRSEVGVTFLIASSVVLTTSASDAFLDQAHGTYTNGCLNADGTHHYGCVLDNFSSYHNTASSPVYGTDLAHLFTRRNLGDGTPSGANVIGIAWIGSVCSSYYGSGLSEDFTSTNKLLVLLTAHEIGHNFNAPHDNATEVPASPCASTPFGFIMNPYVDMNLNYLFSACSKTQMGPEIAGASCLTTVSDSTPTPTATFTPSGPTATPTLGATFTPVVPTATPTISVTPTPVPPTTTPTPTPSVAIGNWKFEEGSGTSVGDSSGFGNPGTAENGMGWGAGRGGGGGVFDGVNDDVRVANSASLNITGTGLSLEAWVKPSAIDNIRALVHKEMQYSMAINGGQLTYADSVTWSYTTIGGYGSVPAGVWSHVAVTFDGTVIRFYVNGAEVGNKPRVGALSATANPVCLGAYNCIAFRLAGTLDEVAVYRRPLSAGEVQAHFAAAPPLSTATPTIAATNTVTPTVTFTTAPAATFTLPPTATSSPIRTPTSTPTTTPTSTPTWTATPLPTFTVAGAPTSTFTIPPTTTFTVPPTATFTAAPTATVTVPGAIPPVGNWRFEEGSGALVADSSGAGNNGAAENGMTWGTGKVGGGGGFDGVNDDVRIANSTSLNVTGTGLSIEAWVKPTAVNSIRVLVHKDQQYSLAINNGKLTYADSIMWSYATMGGFGSVPAGVWTHVAVTFDGSSARFYVNGVEVGNIAHAGSLSATTNPVCLGSYNCSAFPLAGSLDEVAVFRRTLSAAEVQAHFTNGGTPATTPTTSPTRTVTALPTPVSTALPTASFTVPPTATLTGVATPTAPPISPVGNWRFEASSGTLVADSSGSGNTGTAENGMAWGAGKVGAGGVFDGVNDDVRIANSTSLNVTGTGLSLEAWVKPTAVNSIRVLVHKEQQYSLAINNGKLAYADSIMWSYAAMGGFGSVPVGVWTHVAVTIDGSSARFYVNGVEVGNIAHAGSLSATTSPVCLGSYNCVAYPLAGTLDEVAVYPRTLLAAEVRTHFLSAN